MAGHAFKENDEGGREISVAISVKLRAIIAENSTIERCAATRSRLGTMAGIARSLPVA